MSDFFRALIWVVMVLAVCFFLSLVAYLVYLGHQNTLEFCQAVLEGRDGVTSALIERCR